VASAIGDQQGALFGQACFEPGMVKATYGTGGSLMMNIGDTVKYSDNGLLTTVACRVDGEVQYAMEGLLFTVGSVVQWLRDELRLIGSAAETEAAAGNVPDTNGVYVVPAFTGLSAPHWDQYARGTVVGLTRGANRDHLIRASLESMAYQIRDVLDSMAKDTGIETRRPESGRRRSNERFRHAVPGRPARCECAQAQDRRHNRPRRGLPRWPRHRVLGREGRAKGNLHAGSPVRPRDEPRRWLTSCITAGPAPWIAHATGWNTTEDMT
jgi:hypothetical protein